MAGPAFTFRDYMAMAAQANPAGQTMAVLTRRLAAPRVGADEVARWARRMRGMHDAMTAAERLDPTCLAADRRRRVARGSGVAVMDVSQLIRAFEMARDRRGAPAGATLGAVLGLVTNDAVHRDPSHVHPLPGPWRLRDAAIAFVTLAALVALAWRACGFGIERG